MSRLGAGDKAFMDVARDRFERMIGHLPAEVVEAVRTSLRRLGRSRSLGDIARALPEELENLVAASVPALAERPLPVHTAGQARVLAAVAAGASAAVQQAGEVTLLESLGLSGSVMAPAVVGTSVLAWVAELWLAVTIRVRQLESSGRSVDHGVLTAEMMQVVLGGGPTQVLTGRRATRALGRRAAGRIGRRWAAGLVPVVGIAYDGWDARRTIDRVMELPPSAHPPARPGQAARPGAISPPPG